MLFEATGRRGRKVPRQRGPRLSLEAWPRRNTSSLPTRVSVTLDLQPPAAATTFRIRRRRRVRAISTSAVTATAGGTLSGNGVNARTQYDIGGNPGLSASGKHI